MKIPRNEDQGIPRENECADNENENESCLEMEIPRSGDGGIPRKSECDDNEKENESCLGIEIPRNDTEEIPRNGEYNENESKSGALKKEHKRKRRHHEREENKFYDNEEDTDKQNPSSDIHENLKKRKRKKKHRHRNSEINESGSVPCGIPGNENESSENKIRRKKEKKKKAHDGENESDLEKQIPRIDKIENNTIKDMKSVGSLMNKNEQGYSKILRNDNENRGSDVTHRLCQFLSSKPTENKEISKLNRDLQTYLKQGGCARATADDEDDKILKTQREIIEELLSIEKSLLRNQRKKEAQRLREKQAQLEELRSKRRRDGDVNYGEHDDVIYGIDDRLDVLHHGVVDRAIR